MRNSNQQIQKKDRGQALFTPDDGAYVLRIEVVGKNPESKGTFFGLDCVTLFGNN